MTWPGLELRPLNLKFSALTIRYVSLRGSGGWGVGGGGLERGEAETGSVNKPAVKFGLEIEPLGHSDAMGEGRGGEGGSSDNVLSILHHKFPLGLGEGGGFWLFQIESLPDSP